MRAAAFRSNPELVAQWKEMLEKHELLKLVLSVMDEEHPTRFMVQGDDTGEISPTMAAMSLGDTRGYSKYSNGLRLLGIPMPKPTVLPEADYLEEANIS